MDTNKQFKQTIDWYNKNAQGYAVTLSERARKDNMERFASYIPHGFAILDAGCAAGRDTHLPSEKGYMVTGIDISKGLIEVAKKTFPNYHFVVGSFLELPFADNTFNGVWAHASLVHLPSMEDVKKSLAEFHRVLKPGGIIYLYVKEQLGEKKTALVADKFSDIPRFFHYYTQEEMEQYLQKQGFAILEKEKQPDLGNRPGVNWLFFIAKKTTEAILPSI